MAIAPITVTAETSYLSPAAEVQRIEGSLLRVTERSLSVEALVLSDSVEISDTSRMLSAMSEIADAASTAADGGVIDPREVAADAQRFVDSVNALNLGSQFETGGLFGDDTELPLATGLGTVPLADEEGSFLLTLDSSELETALEETPAATSNALAAAVVPLGTELAAQAIQTDLNASQATSAVFAQATINQTDLLTLSAEADLDTAFPETPVVPDLTLSNAELRQALADTLLADALNPATLLPPLATPAVTLPPLPEVDASTQTTSATAPAQITQTDEAELPGENNERTVAVQTPVSVPSPVSTPVQSDITATAMAETQALLTAQDLITTPMEQITRLALNPTVAGAVAAFQLAGDEGGRAARGALQSDAEVVNPVAAILQTEAIASNLANSSEQRQEYPAKLRISEWLATRPGLI